MKCMGVGPGLNHPVQYNICLLSIFHLAHFCACKPQFEPRLKPRRKAMVRSQKRFLDLAMAVLKMLLWISEGGNSRSRAFGGIVLWIWCGLCCKSCCGLARAAVRGAAPRFTSPYIAFLGNMRWDAPLGWGALSQGRVDF